MWIVCTTDNERALIPASCVRLCVLLTMREPWCLHCTPDCVYYWQWESPDPCVVCQIVCTTDNERALMPTLCARLCVLLTMREHWCLRRVPDCVYYWQWESTDACVVCQMVCTTDNERALMPASCARLCVLLTMREPLCLRHVPDCEMQCDICEWYSLKQMVWFMQWTVTETVEI